MYLMKQYRIIESLGKEQKKKGVNYLFQILELSFILTIIIF